MKLIQQAASYANCRLESVSAEVLLLVRFLATLSNPFISGFLLFQFHRCWT